MNRRRFLFLLSGAAVSSLLFFTVNQSQKLLVSQDLSGLPSSLKIIEEDIGAEGLILLKKTPLKPGKFGVVEVQGYMIPSSDWLQFIKNG